MRSVGRLSLVAVTGLRTLMTFAREPITGRTKTRLGPPLDGVVHICVSFFRSQAKKRNTE